MSGSMAECSGRGRPGQRASHGHCGSSDAGSACIHQDMAERELPQIHDALQGDQRV